MVREGVLDRVASCFNVLMFQTNLTKQTRCPIETRQTKQVKELNNVPEDISDVVDR